MRLKQLSEDEMMLTLTKKFDYFLSAFDRHLPTEGHIVFKTEEQASNYISENPASLPHLWVPIEQHSAKTNNAFPTIYTVFIDYAYHLIALFEDITLVNIAQVMIITPKVIVLDKVRYNLPKYLWS